MEFNENQRAVIDQLWGNMAVIASAGSGKTAVLVNRIANLVDNGVNPQVILAVTFSRKSKETMYERLREIDELMAENVNIETFHSLALKIIQDEHKNKYTVWTTTWQKESVIQDALVACNEIESKYSKVAYNDVYLYFMDRRNNIKKKRDFVYSKKSLEYVWNTYCKYKEDNDLIEFDDFVAMANDILDNGECKDRYRSKFKYILADEYQDISTDQAMMMRRLNTTNTMIVGDPLQAIYSFRGGNSKFILDFDEDYDNVTVINLNKNYRCSDDIVRASNQFALTIPDSKHRNYKETVANKSANKEPIIKKYGTRFDEAVGIARTIKENGYRLSDVGILARTNAQLQMIQAAFGKAEIPMNIPGGGVFYEQPEIKLLLSYLRLGMNTNDDGAFRLMYNKPLRWLNKVFMSNCEQAATDYKMSLFDAMEYAPSKFRRGIAEIRLAVDMIRAPHENVGCIIRGLRKKFAIDEYFNKGEIGDDGQAGEKTENMDDFENYCKRFKTIKELFDELNSITISEDDAVNLSTIHRAKGLEFPVVFIIGCNEGILPHWKNESKNDEKRLMYVAMTRAKDELYMSYVENYGMPMVEGKSSFLKKIGNS